MDHKDNDLVFSLCIMNSSVKNLSRILTILKENKNHTTEKSAYYVMKYKRQASKNTH